MTQLTSLRGGISRGEYEVDCDRVAGAIAVRLLTGRTLHVPAGATQPRTPGRTRPRNLHKRRLPAAA